MSDVILRKFWLENETGDSIPLNGERGIWFVDPTGLGVNNNSTFTNFSYGFFSSVEEDKDPQQTIAGDLYFIDPIDPYMMYRRFVDWVSLAQTLYLVYSPTPTRYRRKIKLSYLTKTELTTQQCLKAPIAMYGLTPWFTKTEYRIEGEAGAVANPFIVNQSLVGPPSDSDSEGDDESDSRSSSEDKSEISRTIGGFKGDKEDEQEISETIVKLKADKEDKSEISRTIDGLKGAVESDSSESNEDEHEISGTIGRLKGDNRFRVSTIVYATGHRDAGFILSYAGGLINPSIRIYGYDSGKVYGSCTTVNTIIDAGEVLLYSSDYDNSYIMKQGVYGITDLLNSIDDLNSEVYPRIPVGEPCVVELSSMSQITGLVTINIVNYYRGV